MLATALAPVIGYDDAAKLAKEALQVRADDPRARRSSAGMDPAELDRLLDPAAMTEPGLGGRAGGGLDVAPGPGRYNPRDDRHPPLGSRRRPARPVDGRRLPEIAALPAGLPTVAELFDFMRDAELRFATLRLRIEERAGTARGEDVTTMDTVLRHPGEAQGHDDPARRRRSRRLRDLDLGRRARPDLLERPPARDAAAGPQPAARPRRSGLPGTVARSTSRSPPLPTETLPDTFVHPAGLLPERARDRPLHGDRHGPRRRARGDPARVRPPAHDRARRRSARLPHLDRGRPRHRRDPPAGRDRSAARSPATPRSSSSAPDAPAAAVRVRRSSSRPGRRCSTERRSRARERRARRRGRRARSVRPQVARRAAFR